MRNVSAFSLAVLSLALAFSSCNCDGEPEKNNVNNFNNANNGNNSNNQNNANNMSDVAVDDSGTPLELPVAVLTEARSLALDPQFIEATASDEFAIAGEPNGELTIDGQPVTGNFLVVKTDGRGTPRWGKGIIARDQDDMLQSIDVGFDGGVYVSMVSFSTTLDFGDGVTIAGNNISRMGFVANYAPDGTALWASSYYADNGIRNTFVTSRAANVTTIGTYSIWDPIQYLDENGLAMGPEYKRGSNFTSFAIKLNPQTGRGQWLTLWSAPSTGATVSSADMLDFAGDIVVAGIYEGGPMEQPDATILNADDDGAFISLLDSDGAFKWTVRFPIDSTLIRDAPKVTTDGIRIFASGYFAGDIDIAGDSFSGPGLFAIELDPMDGSVISGTAFGGASSIRDIAVTLTGVSVLVDSRSETPDGMLGGVALPTTPGFYLVQFDETWSVNGFAFFPAETVEPKSLGGTGMVGVLSEPFDFGQGEVPAGGFIAIYD